MYVTYRLECPQNLKPIGAKVRGGRREDEEAIVSDYLCSGVRSITLPDREPSFTKNRKSVQPNPCHLHPQFNVVPTKE